MHKVHFKNAKRQRLSRIADELDFLRRDFAARREEDEAFREAEADCNWATIMVRNAARALGLKL